MPPARLRRQLLLRAGALRRKAAARERRSRASTNTLVRGRSYLESNALKPSTVTAYNAMIQAFVLWVSLECLNWDSVESLQEILLMYYDYLFFEGHQQQASRVTAALRFFIPSLPPLPRLHRATAGWNRLAPPRQRLPLPRVALLAIIALALHDSNIVLALALYISFICYLRPGECQKLRVRSLIRANPAAGPGLQMWGLLLHESVLAPGGQGPSKTGLWDEAILLDRDFWLQPFLEVMLQRPEQQELFRLPASDVKQSFLKYCHHLQLDQFEPCLYQLRHGGASDDAITERRSLLEIKLRGRWRSDASLRRYARTTNLLREVNRMPQQVIYLGKWLEQNLEAAFHFRTRIPRHLIPIDGNA
jgi:hypothetical protein